MTKPHADIKSRQRAEHEGWPEFLALRVHRALKLARPGRALRG